MPLAIPLLSLAALIVSYGMLAAYRGQGDEANESIKGLLLWLAGVIAAVRIPIPHHSVRIFGPVADALRWFAEAIETALAAVVAFFEAPVAQFWYQLAEIPKQTAQALASFATATAHRLAWIENVYVPRYVRLALLGVTGPLTVALAGLHALRAVAIPELRHGLDWTRGRVGRLEREAGRTATRLRRVEAYLSAAGAVVLVATALGRLGLKWIRCRNVAKAGRRVCGMDFDYLDALLAGSLLVVGSVSIVDFAHELQDAEGEVVRAIRGLVREA